MCNFHPIHLFVDVHVHANLELLGVLADHVDLPHVPQLPDLVHAGKTIQFPYHGTECPLLKAFFAKP